MTYNQNAHVHEEHLKSMKDSDGLNDILGYAHLVEGTQHSQFLSKAYLDTIKILSLKVDAIDARKTITTISFMANVMVQNIDLKEVAIVITVVPVTLQSVVQLMEKLVTIVIKRLFVEAVSVASLVPDGREVKVDPGRTNMKFHHVIKLMTVAGTHVNRILPRLCKIKVLMEIPLTFVLMR